MKFVLLIKGGHKHSFRMLPGHETLMIQALIAKVKANQGFDIDDALFVAEHLGIKLAVRDCLAVG